MKRVFKKLGVVAMTLSMFAFSSCEELKELIKFDFDLKGEAIEIVIEPTEETGSQITIGSEQFEKSLEQVIKENAPDADLSKIKAITLTNISAEITKGAKDGNNFQNFSKIYVKVNAEEKEVEDAELVAQTTIEDETTHLEVPVNGGSVDIKSWFSKQNFEYVLQADITEAITEELTIRITADYAFTFGL
ncbi:hypothetical protein G5B30_15915 [Sphingobacterium sp. SGG-5]|uniref:hypothetical protein n=1 Tax=Sphingobacterium sp. SGG-5 TaxID=2710881 RepID=UPI0013EBF867|nr:hypothetical protein [Sphingobacterium sp. SGG-5]NGM63397.1 hypothetical protein [Sphingobacterium sp. SGG-5]